MNNSNGMIPDGLRFAKRPESWVAVQGGRFYKIPRLSEDPESDLVDDIGIEMAGSEFRDAKYLADMEADVLEPLARDRACLIYPAISGPDLRDALLGDDAAHGRSGLMQAMRMLGRLHSTATRSAAELVEYGATTPFFVKPSDTCIQLMRDREKSIVIDGLEVRNFRYDSWRGVWRFFDPHRVRTGPGECDIARFLVSLLMLRWGRSVRCWIWTRFDVKELVRGYQEEGGREVNNALLRFFLIENAAMREYYARKSIKKMPPVAKPLAMAYKNLFFMQIRKWVDVNGL